MYEYKQIIDIGYSELFGDSIIFGLSLQNTEFKFLECNYLFKRGNKGHEGERLIATLYTNLGKEDANKIFDFELQILSYITLLPLTSFDVRYDVSEVENVADIRVTGSPKKIQQIQQIGKAIERQRATQDLFRNVIQIFNSALRFAYMGDQFFEESYLGFFRVVEQIVSWSYNREIRAGCLPMIKQKKLLVSNIESEIDTWFRDHIGMSYDSKHYRNIVDNLIQNINESTRDIFSKINRFCNAHNMSFPADKVHNLIKIRNSIVHGNVDDVNILDNAIFDMEMLALNVISHQFFHKQYFDLIKLKIGYVNY